MRVAVQAECGPLADGNLTLIRRRVRRHLLPEGEGLSRPHLVDDTLHRLHQPLFDVDGERPWALLAAETQGARPQFRAVPTRAIAMDGDTVGITSDARSRLGVEDGQKVWIAHG